MYTRLLSSLIALFAIFLLALFILPTLASTSWGKEHLLSFLNRKIPGKIAIEKLRLGWFSAQEVEGLRIHDAAGREILTLDKLSTDLFLPNLLLHSPKIGITEIERLKAHLVQNEQGITNLEQALALSRRSNPSEQVKKEKHKETSRLSLSQFFTGAFSLSDSQILWEAPQMQAVEIRDLSASARSSTQENSLSFVLTGTSIQNDLQGKFFLKGLLQGFDAEGKMAFAPNENGWLLPLDTGKVQLAISIDQLAVDVVDHFVALKYPQWAGMAREGLGPTLDLKLTQLATPKNLDLSLEVNSQQLQASVNTRSKEGKTQLKAPGKIVWALTPTFAAYFLPKKIALAQEAKLEGLLHYLTWTPQQENALHADWKLQNAELVNRDTQEVLTLKELQGSLEHATEQKKIKATLSGHTLFEGAPSTWDLAALFLTDPLKFDSLSLKTEEVPVQLAQFLELDPHHYLRTFLGPSFDADLSVEQKDETSHVDLQLASERLTLPSLSLEITPEKIAQKAPLQFSYTLTQDLFSALPSSLAELGRALQEPTPLLVTLQQFQAPTYPEESFLTELKGQVEFSAAPLRMRAADGEATLSNLAVKLQKEGEKIAYKISGALVPGTHAPLFLSALGTTSRVKAEGEMNLHNSANQLELMVNSDLVDLRASLAHSKELWHLRKPAQLQYTLKPALLKALGLNTPGVPELTAPTLLETTIESLSFVFPAFSLSSLTFKGKGYAAETRLNDPYTQSAASLKDLYLAWDFQDEMMFSAKGKTALGNSQAGELDIVATLKKGAQEHSPTLYAKGSLLRLPVAFIATASGIPELPGLIGPSLDLYFTSTFQPTDPVERGKSELSFSGEGLSGGLAFTIRDRFLLKRAASKVEWRLTPSRFALLQRFLGSHALGLKLLEPSNLKISFQDLDVKMSQLGFHATALLDPLVLGDTTGQFKTTLDQTSAELKTDNLASALHFNLKTGDTTFRGTLHSLLSPQNRSLDLSASTKGLPTWLLRTPSFMDAALSSSVEALLGERFQAEATYHSLGNEKEIKALVSSPNKTRLHLEGYVSGEHLLLRQPFELEFALSPQIAEAPLFASLPLLKYAMNSDQLIKLTIDPLGFSLPLNKPSLETLQLSQGSLELGRMQFRNTGQLASLTSLLHYERTTQRPFLSIWFTPLYFSSTDGILRLSRMDALVADKYPLALWGKINFPKDRVNMVVGVTASALKEAYGLGNLDSRYMLQLPITGGVKNAAIDKVKAAARITALVAQSKGPQGEFISEVFDLIGIGTQDAQIPPPTTPLPWGPEPEQEAPVENKPTSSPLQKIQKGASQLLKFIKS